MEAGISLSLVYPYTLTAYMFIGEPIKCLYKCTRQALNINCCLPTEGATQVGNCTSCIQSGRFARVSMVKPLISRGVRLFACVGLQSSCACSNGQSMVVGQPSRQATCDQRRMPPPAMVLSCPYGEYLKTPENCGFHIQSHITMQRQVKARCYARYNGTPILKPSRDCAKAPYDRSVV